jgi:hypothetical protein
VKSTLLHPSFKKIFFEIFNTRQDRINEIIESLKLDLQSIENGSNGGGGDNNDYYAKTDKNYFTNDDVASSFSSPPPRPPKSLSSNIDKLEQFFNDPEQSFSIFNDKKYSTIKKLYTYYNNKDTSSVTIEHIVAYAERLFQISDKYRVHEEHFEKQIILEFNYNKLT